MQSKPQLHTDFGREVLQSLHFIHLFVQCSVLKPIRWCEATRKKAKADSTLRSSQAVPHPSTDRALRCLTSEVKRDPVHSTRYGRRRKHARVEVHSCFLTLRALGVGYFTTRNSLILANPAIPLCRFWPSM